MDEEAHWYIRPLSAPSLPSIVEIGVGGVTIGRAVDNGLEIPSGTFPGVSANHAHLELVDGEIILEDLGSRNGTLVNGERIERRAIRNGEVFQLGGAGPRFALIASSGLDETVHMPIVAAGESQRLGSRTMSIMRERLGIPEGARVEEMIHKRARRHTLATALLTVFILVGSFAAFIVLRGENREMQARTSELARDVEQRLTALVQNQQESWQDQNQRLEEARSGWKRDKSALESERERLEAGIQKLEQGGRTAADELHRLQSKLDETTESLELYNPVNLAQAKLREVTRVERSVVLVEAKQSLCDAQTGKILHVMREADGQISFNFEAMGKPAIRESTGSGFCISEDGWIITNAHVVLKKGDRDELELADTDLESHVVFDVVFSGDDVRHRAELFAWSSEEKEDLALLKIEPFDEIPFLDSLDPDIEEPESGSEVFLLGFPLGKQALQQGDTVIASTFRGIVSRRVDYYLQVDAAVHPGNSGGPLINGKGQIVGVVVGMQAIGPNPHSSAIGYIIPVAEVKKIWPPSY